MLYTYIYVLTLSIDSFYSMASIANPSAPGSQLRHKEVGKQPRWQGRPALHNIFYNRMER